MWGRAARVFGEDSEAGVKAECGDGGREMGGGVSVASGEAFQSPDSEGFPVFST